MRHDRRGFTLIELLVSLTIFSIVAVAVYGAFAGGVTVWRRAQAASATYQTARAILEAMARDLRAATRISKAEFVGGAETMSFLVIRRGPDIRTSPAEPSRAGAISGVISEPITWPIRRVTYAYARSEVTRLDESYAEGLQTSHRTPDVFTGPLAGFGLQYAMQDEDDPTAPLEWSDRVPEDDRLPAGVRITVRVADGRAGVLRFTKTVFLPQGLVSVVREPKGLGGLTRP